MTPALTFEVGAGPSQFARFYQGGVAPGEVKGWDNGHTYSAAATAYSFKHFIEPEVAQEFPDWSSAQVRTEAVRRLQVRLAEHKISSEQETRRQDSFSVTWHIEEVDGRQQMVSYYTDGQKQTLEGLWKNTRQFAQDKGKLSHFNAYEEQVQLSMQQALINGEAKGAATIISHPDGMRYFSVWEKRDDGVIQAKQIDFTFDLGKDFSVNETKTLMDHIQIKYASNVIASEQTYPHILLKEGSIEISDIKTIATAQRIAQEAVNHRISADTPLVVDTVRMPESAGVSLNTQGIKAPSRYEEKTLAAVKPFVAQEAYIQRPSTILEQVPQVTQKIVKPKRENTSLIPNREILQKARPVVPTIVDTTSDVVVQPIVSRNEKPVQEIKPAPEVSQAGLLVLSLLSQKSEKETQGREVLPATELLGVVAPLPQEKIVSKTPTITEPAQQRTRDQTPLRESRNQQTEAAIVFVLSDTLVVLQQKPVAAEPLKIIPDLQQFAEVTPLSLMTIDSMQAVSDLAFLPQESDPVAVFVPESPVNQPTLTYVLSELFPPLADSGEHSGIENQTLAISRASVQVLGETIVERSEATRVLLFASAEPVLIPAGLVGLSLLAKELPSEVTALEVVLLQALSLKQETQMLRQTAQSTPEEQVTGDTKAVVFWETIRALFESTNWEEETPAVDAPEIQRLPLLNQTTQSDVPQFVLRSVVAEDRISSRSLEEKRAVVETKHALHFFVLLAVWLQMQVSFSREQGTDMADTQAKKPFTNTEHALLASEKDHDASAIQTPWILLALIRHMSLLRESGTYQQTTKRKKQKRKKQVLPVSGVIFSYL